MPLHNALQPCSSVGRVDVVLHVDIKTSLLFCVTAATLRAMTAADLVHEVNSIACCRLCGWRMLLVLHSMRNTCTLEFEPFIARRA